MIEITDEELKILASRDSWEGRTEDSMSEEAIKKLAKAFVRNEANNKSNPVDDGRLKLLDENGNIEE